MSILLNKSYLVNESTKGEGGSKKPQILSTWFVHSPVNKCQNNIDYQTSVRLLHSKYTKMLGIKMLNSNMYACKIYALYKVEI